MKDEQVQQLADELKKLEPGFLPYPIFEQVARLVALPILEFIPLRMSDRGKVEVLLIERGVDDAIWPGMLHTPGTVIRATDIGQTGKNWRAFERVLKDELLKTHVADPYYVGSLLHESKRGVEQAQLYWVEVLDEPKVGKFYEADNLPPNLIDSQNAFIEAAVRNFQSYKERNAAK